MGTRSNITLTDQTKKYKQIMSLANFNGNWEQTEKGANFKDFLAALGVGLLKRNVANNMGRTITFEAIDDKNFHVISKSKLKTNDKKFCLGVSQEGKRDDDMECTTVFHLNDGKIVQDEEAKDGKKYQHVWEVDGNVMKMTLKIGSIECVQVYKKI